MKRYTIYCNEEQTRKALELGAPIEYAKVIDTIKGNSIRIPEESGEFYLIPTAEQMIGWLGIEKGLYVEPYFNGESAFSFTPIISTMEDGEVITCESKESFEEATLAAIDAALDYLSNK